MSRIELGPCRDIVSEEPDDDGWYGPFHDPDFALKVFAKLRRGQEYRGKPQMLVGIGGDTTWLKMPANLIEEAIRRSPSQRYRNCKISTKWWFRLAYSVSVWPMKHRDESLNAENNWGEEE